MIELDKLFQETYEEWIKNKSILISVLDIKNLCERYIKWESTHSKEEKLNGSD